MTQAYALIIATWTAVSGQPITADKIVADHNLSREDCQAYVAAYKPSQSDLGHGLVISHTAMCEPEEGSQKEIRK